MTTDSYIAYLGTKPFRRGDLVRVKAGAAYAGKYARVDKVNNLTAVATIRVNYTTVDVHINKLELVAQGWNSVGKSIRVPGTSYVCRW